MLTHLDIYAGGGTIKHPHSPKNQQQALSIDSSQNILLCIKV